MLKMSTMSRMTETSDLSDQREPKFWLNPNVDIIYHNMHAGSDFMTSRMGSEGSVEEILLQVAKQVENGCYKIVSISASKHSFVIVFSTELSRAELRERGFPFPIPEESGEMVGQK